MNKKRQKSIRTVIFNSKGISKQKTESKTIIVINNYYPPQLQENGFSFGKLFSMALTMVRIFLSI